MEWKFVPLEASAISILLLLDLLLNFCMAKGKENGGGGSITLNFESLLTPLN